MAAHPLSPHESLPMAALSCRADLLRFAEWRMFSLPLSFGVLPTPQTCALTQPMGSSWQQVPKGCVRNQTYVIEGSHKCGQCTARAPCNANTQTPRDADTHQTPIVVKIGLFFCDCLAPHGTQYSALCLCTLVVGVGPGLALNCNGIYNRPQTLGYEPSGGIPSGNSCLTNQPRNTPPNANTQEPRHTDTREISFNGEGWALPYETAEGCW